MSIRLSTCCDAPGDYEMEQADLIIEQIIRPTGSSRSRWSASTMGQMDDLLGESSARGSRESGPLSPP